MSYIRREIKAEIMMKSASNAHAQRYKLTSGDDDQGVKETRDRDEVDWYDTTEQDTEPRMSSRFLHAFNLNRKTRRSVETNFHSQP